MGKSSKNIIAGFVRICMIEIPFVKKLQLLKNLGLWERKGQSVLGIDIGSSSIKVVQLRKEKERAILETYGELATGPYGQAFVGQAVQLVEDKMVEMIKDVIKEAGITTKEAVVSIPLRSSFVTLIDLPQMGEKELAEAVPFEARRYIPVPTQEVVVDWWAIPEGFGGESQEDVVFAKKKKTMQVLLVAIHKNIIEKYQSIIKTVGLKAKSFEIEVFSGVRSIIRHELSPILIIDFGASSTKMTMIDYGIVRMSHTIDRGSQDLTNALAKSLGIEFARAEEIKREIGLSSKPEHQQEVGVIEPLLDYVLSDVNRMIQDYRKRYGRSATHIVLAGGGALLNGLVDFTVKRVGLAAKLADPFARVEYPVFLQPVLKDIGPSFATAIGLAMRELK